MSIDPADDFEGYMENLKERQAEAKLLAHMLEQHEVSVGYISPIASTGYGAQ